MSAPARGAADPRRRALMAKVQIARGQQKLDDQTYRAVLLRVTGKTSSTACSDAELVAILDDFKAKGWEARPAVRAKRQPADNPVARKARALWISLHQLGVVREPSERALEAFGRRQLKVESLFWADQSQGFRLIEALKDMALRAGWDASGEDVHAIKVRLVQRQWVRLGELCAVQGGGAPGYSGLDMWAKRKNFVLCKKSVEYFTDTELEATAAGLGAWIRATEPRSSS